MARFPFRLKRAVDVFILAPLIVPGHIVAVGIGKIFLAYGLAYSVAGVILVQMVGTLAMMIRLLTAALETIPDDLIEAASSLGAGWRQVFLNPILPLSVPGLMAGGLLSFIGSFEELTEPSSSARLSSGRCRSSSTSISTPTPCRSRSPPSSPSSCWYPPSPSSSSPGGSRATTSWQPGWASSDPSPLENPGKTPIRCPLPMPRPP
ncbi:ABC transporter permease [Chthonobacter rhizosphaerae]|uniref:ABC transporter permease n=1 Tax=Chthonobacter rhizosphaerae TaxID=2735553 RepID=UPI001FE930EB|nr:ABC transporter permease subunit [Chthonobacter rhizosphaerae]